MEHRPENLDGLPSSFVVRMSDRSHALFLSVPVMWIVALVVVPSMRSLEPLNIAINLFAIVVVIACLRYWWFILTPIVVDRAGIWQFRTDKPRRVLIPWEDVISAHPVTWSEQDNQAVGVLLELTASSTWPASVHHTPSEIRDHLSRFIDDPIPSNPALLTAHFSEFDTDALASFISRIAESNSIQMELDSVVGM